MRLHVCIDLKLGVVWDICMLSSAFGAAAGGLMRFKSWHNLPASLCLQDFLSILCVLLVRSASTGAFARLCVCYSDCKLDVNLVEIRIERLPECKLCLLATMSNT